MSTNKQYIIDDPLFLWNLQVVFCPDVLLEEIDEMGEDFYRSFYENGETPMDEILERRKKAIQGNSNPLSRLAQYPEINSK